MQILRSRRARRQAAAPIRPSACGAPRSSMYFGPDGKVRACCVNTTYTLGDVAEQSIRDIWEGARIASLRQALDQHDYSLGCRDCEHRVAAGDRAWSTAPQYDDYLDVEPGAYPRRMDFILSITCNLQCAMCDGELSSSIRIHREKRPPLAPAYGDAFFEELRDFLPHLDLAVFLGGEPFVAREPQRVFDLMLELDTKAEIRVVTNGTQWNPRVERYLRELPINLAVSIDGHSAETLESLRVGVDRERVFENLSRYQEAVAGHDGSVSIHFCLMRQNWHEFGDLLLEADRRDIHVIVMTVTGPAGFSLWDLPAAELRPVLEGLERQGEHLADQLGRNRQVWDDELARVRRHLASLDDGTLPAWVTTSWGLAEGVPVDITARPDATPDATPDVAPTGAAARASDLEAELAAWADRSPLVLHVQGTAVVAVDPVDWAAPLDPQAWVGLDVTQLTTQLGVHFAHVGEPVVDDRGDGVSTSTTTVVGPEGEVEFRSVASMAFTAAGAEGRVALATPAALGAPAVGG